MFSKSWASFHKLGDNATSPDVSIPFFDRSVIKDPHGFDELYLQAFSQLMRSKFLSKHDCNNWAFALKTPKSSLEKPVASTFTISRSDIAQLKQKFAPKLDHTPSSFQLVCAFTWVCLTKATTTTTINNSEDVNLLYVVYFRSRLDPPIPSTYFGNCFMGIKVSAKRGDIVGENGIVVAVKSIMKEMKGLMREGFVRNDEERLERVVSTGPNQFFATAGSTKFGFYEVDFGWGRPEKVQMTSVAKTGAIMFTEGNSGKYGSGVEVSFVRGEKEMEAFRGLFVDGLKDLYSSQKVVSSSL